MLKRFFDGMIFGVGFAFAFAVICGVFIYFVVPTVMWTASSQSQTPEFKNPVNATIIQGSTKAEGSKQEFSFFKNSGARMEIPPSGGILGMAPLGTPASAKRQSTYQLWLTQTEFWQIRTTDDQTQIER